jgi:epoxyqueuosine reductase QueG
MDGTLLRQRIDETLEPLRPLKWGVCDADFSLDRRYAKALVIAVPYSHMITLDDYTEPFHRNLQMGTGAKSGRVRKQITELFRSLEIDFAVPPYHEFAEEFEVLMTESFSTKEAARLAGLGWIGKSNLLITKEFGPRLHIAVFLLNEPLEADTPVDRSYCGNCDRCFRNCPFQALKNKIWTPGIPREEQVDYVKCSHSRLKTVGSIGRKIGCAKCIASCPNGTGKSLA